MDNNVAHIQPILHLTLTQLGELMTAMGEKPFRAQQVADWLYATSVDSFDDMTNLSRALREKLAGRCSLYRSEIVSRQVSRDGTRKYVMKLVDGAYVEAVGLPTSDRLTVCMSSQVGCAMGCVFCATGQAGFTRNLFPGEMTEQVRLIAEDFERRVTNVVVMGQGEPFLNYDNVLAALRILNNQRYFSIGARHITLSTCGIINGIRKLSEEPEQFTLAVSLHSAVQATRDALMPGVKGQPLTELFDALVDYTRATGRRPSLEYTLIEGAQTSEREIERLSDFASRLGAHVNLIAVNASSDASIKPPSPHTIARIQSTLERAGVNATVRTERGSDIAAACGQLAGLFHTPTELA